MSTFTRWAVQEPPLSPIYAQTGVFRSISLFREPAGIEHEFAVICVGDGVVPDSWIRVERAARMKHHWTMIQADSLCPIFKGVELRESISFAKCVTNSVLYLY